jgi:hypothetical protein
MSSGLRTQAAVVPDYDVRVRAAARPPAQLATET